jgi:hypothetical protein
MAKYRTAAELRQDAAHCRELAAKAIITWIRATLDRVADSYETMARQVEELTKDGHWPPPTSN